MNPEGRYRRLPLFSQTEVLKNIYILSSTLKSVLLVLQAKVEAEVPEAAIIVDLGPKECPQFDPTTVISFTIWRSLKKIVCQ